MPSGRGHSFFQDFQEVASIPFGTRRQFIQTLMHDHRSKDRLEMAMLFAQSR